MHFIVTSIFLFYRLSIVANMDHHYPNVATHYEARQLVLTYYNYITIPYHWILPDIKDMIFQIECNGHKVISQPIMEIINSSLSSMIYEEIDDGLKDIYFKIPDKFQLTYEEENEFHYNKVRTKRFIELLLGAASISLGLYNKVDISLLKNKVNKLQDQHNEISSLIQKNNYNIENVMKDIESYKVFYNTKLRYLVKAESKTICTLQQHMLDFFATNYYISLYVNKYRDLLNLVIKGEVTPDLVPVSKMKKFLKNLLYQDHNKQLYNIYYIYKFSKFILLHINPSLNIVSGLLVIPIIHNDNIYYKYYVSSVTNDYGYLFRPSLLTTMSLTSSPKNLLTNALIETCERNHNMILCPDHIIKPIHKDECIIQQKDVSPTCFIKENKLSDSTERGVLISSKNKCLIQKIIRNRKRSDLIENNFTYIHYTDFDFLSCTDKMYYGSYSIDNTEDIKTSNSIFIKSINLSLSQETFEYNHSFNFLKMDKIINFQSWTYGWNKSIFIIYPWLFVISIFQFYIIYYIYTSIKISKITQKNHKRMKELRELKSLNNCSYNQGI